LTFEEFRIYMKNNFEVQDFLLKYCGTQTFVNANRRYKIEKFYWKHFYEKLSKDFGDVKVDVIMNKMLTLKNWGSNVETEKELIEITCKMLE